MSARCGLLSTEPSFAAYVATMRNVTGPDLSVQAMTPCRQQICSVLYGIGNADISGIGVIIGYILELALGVSLTVGVVLLQHPSEEWSRAKASVYRAFATYADAAILLNFAIQLASVIVLIEKDYGINAVDFGALTVEVTWAAALLTMLPMLLICLNGIDMDEDEELRIVDRKDLQITLVCVSWILFLYTFISRLIADFGPSQISTPKPGAPPPILSPQEALNIQTMCFNGPSSFSAAENTAFEVFAVSGSIVLSVLIVGALGWMILDLRRPDLVDSIRDSRLCRRGLISARSAQLLLTTCVLLWALPQIWAIFRLRSMQRGLAKSIGTSDSDNDWGFGQIMAVAVFMPVFVELLYVYFKGPPGWEMKEE